MRTSLVTRTTTAIASAALLLSIGAAAALAKEGVEVALAAPISADAGPGDVVAVFFTLSAISDTGTQPMRGSPVFIRLYGSGGSMTEAAGVETSRAGTYKAMVEIPIGGALRAEFAIRGATVDANGTSGRSDIVWPYDGILVAAAAPAAVDPNTFRAPGADPAQGVVADPAGNGSTTVTTTSPASTAGGAAPDPRFALAAGLLLVLSFLAIAGGRLLGRRRTQRTVV